MYKKKILTTIVTTTLSFGTFGISSVSYASTQAEQELIEYLKSVGIQDNVTWERIEGDTLSKAKVYGISYVPDAGAKQEEKVTIKEMTFNDYSVSDSGVSTDVRYKGITDEDGVHILLSKKLMSDLKLQDLGYEKLDDIQINLKYTMDKTEGTLDGSLQVEQDDVLDVATSFKTEGLDMLINSLVSLDVAALDPNIILMSAMAAKIHNFSLQLADDGCNQRLLEHESVHRAEIDAQYKSCLEGVEEFSLKGQEQGCAAIRDYFLAEKDKLHISINPQRPFSVAEYMPMFMLVGSAGPDAMSKLVEKILQDLNLKISN